jgi:hypothetical protein
MPKFIALVVLAVIAGVVYLVYAGPNVTGPEKNENIRFGFVRAVTTNGNYGIIFDEATWLTGEEGENAAIEAGLCTEETRATCLPNGFIIDNPSSATQNLEFSTDIVIAMQTLNMENEGVKENQITKEHFERLINDPVAHWQSVPFQLLMKNGLIRIVEEVYVP